MRRVTSTSLAKSGLDEAIGSEQKWQKDAVLSNISTEQANSDGTAPKWSSMFSMPETKADEKLDILDTFLRCLDTRNLNGLPRQVDPGKAALRVQFGQPVHDASASATDIQHKACKESLPCGD